MLAELNTAGVKTSPAQGLGFSALFSVGLTID